MRLLSCSARIGPLVSGTTYHDAEIMIPSGRWEIESARIAVLSAADDEGMYGEGLILLIRGTDNYPILNFEPFVMGAPTVYAKERVTVQSGDVVKFRIYGFTSTATGSYANCNLWLREVA